MSTKASVHFINSLAEMPAFLDRGFVSVPKALLAAKPENDKSPLLEHVWHLRDCETDLYGLRIRRAIEEDTPFLEPMNIGHWPTERGYLTKSLGQGLSEFKSHRSALVSQLLGLSETEMEREAHRSDGSRSSILDLVAELLEHDQDHRVRIAAVLAGFSGASVA